MMVVLFGITIGVIIPLFLHLLKRIDSVETKLTDHMDRVETKLGDRIDAQGAELRQEIRTVESNLRTELGGRIDKVEATLRQDIRDQTARIDQQTSRIDDLITAVHNHIHTSNGQPVFQEKQAS